MVEDLELWLAKAVIYLTALDYLLKGMKWFLKWIQPQNQKSLKKKRSRRKQKRKKS